MLDLHKNHSFFPASIYPLKVNNRNTRTSCKICSKLTIKTSEWRHWPATFFKKGLWHRCFPVNFAKFSRTTFFKEHLQWLVLLERFMYIQVTSCVQGGRNWSKWLCYCYFRAKNGLFKLNSFRKLVLWQTLDVFFYICICHNEKLNVRNCQIYKTNGKCSLLPVRHLIAFQFSDAFVLKYQSVLFNFRVSHVFSALLETNTKTKSRCVQWIFFLKKK